MHFDKTLTGTHTAACPVRTVEAASVYRLRDADR